MYDADDKKGVSRDYLGGAVIDIADGIKEGWIVYDSMKTPEPKFLDLYLSINLLLKLLLKKKKNIKEFIKTFF